jgi:hypothetical protein
MLIIQCIILLFLGALVLLTSALTLKVAEDLESFREETERLKARIRENEYKTERLDNIVQILEQHKRRE